MLRRITLSVAVLAVAWFGVHRIRLALASDVQLLRWRLEEMQEAFNEGNMRGVSSGFSESFRDESSGARKDDVHGALVSLYMQEKHPETRGFNLRVELPEELLSIQLEEGADTATVDCTARVSYVDSGKLWWDVEARVDFRKEGKRWRVVGSSQVNHNERGRGAAAR